MFRSHITELSSPNSTSIACKFTYNLPVNSFHENWTFLKWFSTFHRGWVLRWITFSWPFEVTMVRSRVLSFISAFSAPIRQLTPDPPKSPRRAQSPADRNPQNGFSPADGSSDPSNPSKPNRSSTRPLSMAITYQPPKTDTTQDTLPELLPVFNFLNTHANKLYQEGYFLKLSDLDTRRCLSKRSTCWSCNIPSVHPDFW
jgi:hypothetical protein